jgi:hypothetical protein
MPPLPPQHTHTNGVAASGPDFSKLPPNIAESLAKLAGRGGTAAGGDPPTGPVTADTDTGSKPTRGT